MKSVSAADARLVLARVHGLSGTEQRRGKTGVLSVFQKHQCVQSDPIDVAGRNADLALQSRVIDYHQQHLTDLLYGERQLFEYFCKMLSVMPVELYPIFKHKMTSFAERDQVRSFFRKYRKETRIVLRAMEKGPVSSREILGMRSLKWGWGHNANLANIILTRLWVSGRAMISHRDGAVKYYALPSEVIPEKLLNAEPPELGEDRLEMASIIMNASRLVMPGGGPEQWYEVGKTADARRLLIELERRGRSCAIELEGSREKLYVPIEDIEEWDGPKPSENDYVRFLAPLDSLLWNRRIFELVYGRAYAWEVYKKPQDRKYGYYCLPLLFDGEYVGLLDPYYQKRDKVLEIRNFHIFDNAVVKESFLDVLNRELRRLCEYLGATKTDVKRCPEWATQALKVIA